MVLRLLKRLLVVLVLAVAVALGISAVGFTIRQYDRFDRTSRVEEIENDLVRVRGSLQVGQDRQREIEKITAIINQYNKEMSEALKASIAGEIYLMEIKYDNLNVDLICATITHESARTWNPAVISPAGALGLMQIMPKTGEFLAEFEGITWTTAKEVLFDPISNIRMGCNYLSTLIDFYGLEGALAAYNGGAQRAARWLASNKAEGILWKETQNYVPAVMKLYQKYKN